MATLDSMFALDKIRSDKGNIQTMDIRQDDRYFDQGIVKGYSTLLECLVYIYVERDSTGVYVVPQNSEDNRTRLAELESFVRYQSSCSKQSIYWSRPFIEQQIAVYIDVMISLGLLCCLTQSQQTHFVISPEVNFYLDVRATSNTRLYRQYPQNIQDAIQDKFEPREAIYSCLNDPLEEWLGNLEEMKEFSDDYGLTIF